jgi:hypothetical protein
MKKRFCTICAHPKHPSRDCMIANCKCSITKPRRKGSIFHLGDMISTPIFFPEPAVSIDIMVLEEPEE